MVNKQVSTEDIYLSIAKFYQYVDVDSKGNEILQETYKLHATFKDGEEWIHPAFKDYQTIATLKRKVQSAGTINLDNWIKLEKWEKLKLIEYKDTALTNY